MSEFSIQRPHKSSGPTVPERNREEITKKLPSSRATMLRSYWATYEIQRPWHRGYMDPRIQSSLATSRFPARLNFQRYWVTWFLGSEDPDLD
ncbi:hypothetical protein PIB30_060568 [Stylosanthes scabra]|uniref:Uncharacterized protein n=1 Tax=Stylosanthes scabra TaxID=79078 RepID=A0ABU6WIW6_9FABA|nr:hypothetical protein [Stylosanthes scabra]